MSDEQQEFEQLLDRIRAGSQEAVRELLRQYGGPLRVVIRQKLNVHMRSVFDSVDFMQDVWASFFAGEMDLTFNDPNALIRFLVQLASNKVREEVRRRLISKRHNFNRERSLDGSARAEVAGLSADLPTPGELAATREEWERLLRGRPPHQVRILEMLRDGHTQKEVAAELGLNERTVRRLIEKVMWSSRS